MVDWSKVSKEDMVLVDAIVSRAADMKLVAKHLRMPLTMDIQAAHIASPLRLRDLLNSPDGDFAHDITGIIAHIDRETGALLMCFLPRCAR